MRLIARRWVKTGAEPDFSWEFWRELHDGQQVWRLFRARPASSWQSRWERRKDVLFPQVRDFVNGRIDGALVTDREHQSGWTRSAMQERFEGASAQSDAPPSAGQAGDPSLPSSEGGYETHPEAAAHAITRAKIRQ